MESEGETDLSGEERVGTWSSLMNADLQMNVRFCFRITLRETFDLSLSWYFNQ